MVDAVSALSNWLHSHGVVVPAEQVAAVARQLAGDGIEKRFVAYPSVFWMCGYDSRTQIHRSCYIFPHPPGVKVVAYLNHVREEVYLFPDSLRAGPR